MAKHSVGKNVRRKEGVDKVLGTATYIDDLTVPTGRARNKLRERDTHNGFGDEPRTFRLLKRYPAEHRIKADSIELTDSQIRVFGLLYHKQNPIMFVKIRTCGSGKKRGAQRRINGPVNVRRIELLPILTSIKNLTPGSSGTLCEFRWRKMRNRRHPTGHGGAVSIHTLHRCKIKRGIRLTEKNLLYESRSIRERQL